MSEADVETLSLIVLIGIVYALSQALSIVINLFEGYYLDELRSDIVSRNIVEEPFRTIVYEYYRNGWGKEIIIDGGGFRPTAYSRDFVWRRNAEGKPEEWKGRVG